MRFFHLTFLMLTALFAYSCQGPAPGRAFPLDEMRDGDLAFRCGRGVFSRAVTTAENEGIYSHVGLLFKDGDRWVVVHAVPGEREFAGDFDRVKKEDADIFYGDKRAKRGCLVHTGLTDSAAVANLKATALAAARDSVRFDNDYNLADSTEVYCTEFVWRLYRNAGIDLSEGRSRYVHIFHIDGDCLLPEHLLQYKHNNTYFKF